MYGLFILIIHYNVYFSYASNMCNFGKSIEKSYQMNPKTTGLYAIKLWQDRYWSGSHFSLYSLLYMPLVKYLLEMRMSTGMFDSHRGWGQVIKIKSMCNIHMQNIHILFITFKHPRKFNECKIYTSLLKHFCTSVNKGSQYPRNLRYLCWKRGDRKTFYNSVYLLLILISYINF